MDRMQNEQTMTDGIGSEQNRRVPAMPRGRELQARADGVSENGERRSMAPRKRKPKQGRRREAARVRVPKDQKSMGWAWVLLGLAALWVINPADFDFIPIVGWADDFCIGWWAVRNWREAKRQGMEGNAAPDMRRPPEEPLDAEIVDDAEWAPRRSYRRPMPVEKPGFFARLFKAVTYLLTGGGGL